MFNRTFTTYQPQQLIVPNKGNEGWQTIGTGMKVAGGLMSWLDKKKQAQRLQEAQDKWYDALTSYLNSQNKEPIEEELIEEPVEEENVYTRFLPVRSSTDEEQMALANRMAKESSEEEAFDNYRRALALAQLRNSRGGF